jgi:hypothetical protein
MKLLRTPPTADVYHVCAKKNSQFSVSEIHFDAQTDAAK